MNYFSIEETCKKLGEFCFGNAAEAVTITFFPSDDEMNWFDYKYTIWLHGCTEPMPEKKPANWDEDDWNTWINSKYEPIKNVVESLSVSISFRATNRGYEHCGGILCKLIYEKNCSTMIKVNKRNETKSRDEVPEKSILLFPGDVNGSMDVINIVCQEVDCKESDFVGFSD